MKTIKMTNNRVENISTAGRILRFSVGAAMLSPLFITSGPIGGFAILALLAILPVVCGIDGFCPLTAWLKRKSTESNSTMNTIQRGSYAGLSIALIGSVFVLPAQPLGILAVLPLLGIYPAIVSLFGVEVLGEWLRSFQIQDSKPVSDQVVSVDRMPRNPQDHGHVAHAA